ncbi:MAG: two-component regulator propeller domain-containing protein [Ignavibacteriota bacterium]
MKKTIKILKRIFRTYFLNSTCWLSIIILLVLQFNILAQNSNITFEHLNLDNGLPPNVTCIFQDRIGYIWFGTSSGLYRYDGYSLKEYSPSSTNITNANIRAICDDKEGNIWIGHAHGLDKLNPSKEIFTHYILNPQMPLTDWRQHVVAALEDRNGKLWIGTGGGLYLFDKTMEIFKWVQHDTTNPASIYHNPVHAIYEDGSGTLWFGTGEGLDKLDKAANKFTHYYNAKDFKEYPGLDKNPHNVTSIIEDRDGRFWLGTSGGLVEFNRKDGTFTQYKNDPKNPASIANDFVRSICEDFNGYLWMSTYAGLDIFDKNSRKFSHYTYNKLDPGSLSSNDVGKILFDTSGTIWITTYGRGVNKHIPQYPYLKQYTSEIGKPGKLPLDELEDLVEDRNGTIWIGTDKGLLSFDPKKELFKKEFFKMPASALLFDKAGTLWISSFLTGNNGYLYYKRNKDKKINQLFDLNGKPYNEFVSFMSNSGDGCIWLGTPYGNLLKLNPSTIKVEQFAGFERAISAMYEDKTGLLWIGTYDGGLICYDQFEKIFKRFTTNPNDTNTISGDAITSLCEDGTGTLWIIANTALDKFDREKQKIIRVGEKDGFPKKAFNLIDDTHGNLWITTINGLVKYNPFTKQFKNYAENKPRWGYKMRNGDLYFILAPSFQKKQSIIRFCPDSLQVNSFIPPVVITLFKKFEKSYPFDKKIKLSYQENFISFEFSALSYISPEKNQYAYKMEGVDKDWVYSGTRRYASYPNLSPGEYIFRVKGSNNDAVWNEAGTSLRIIISPPFWKSWWAYLLYACFLLSALYAIRRYEMNRLSFKNQVKLDSVVLKEREETDKMKSRFFANISHEFRTPLTLILAPAEKIISNTSDDHIKDANIIRRNSRRLLQLINQLLDLSKLEAGKLKLEASKGNIVSFVKGVALSFESLAESKDITLKLLPEKEFIELYFDREKMMKILTNILSNAFKFTSEEGKITVSITELDKPSNVISKEFSTEKSLTNNMGKISPFARNDNRIKSYVEIKISDTGIGIPSEEIPKLFDRFYQVDSSHTREYEGTGIGLALTKELVELHHGSIRVESTKEDVNLASSGWTEFTLELPLGRDHLKDEEIIKAGEKIIEPDLSAGRPKVLVDEERYLIANQISEQAETIKEGLSEELQEEKTIILVVEDNYDMREYIKESLDSNYVVVEAVNGEQGVRKAEKIIPDLIISDMMMPKMDGNELVRILKNDEKTSHIPIILLTAKAGHEDKLEGLEIGADDYLTKPFDIKELQVRIKNLISIRKKLQEKYSKIQNLISEVKAQKLSSIDEKFMFRVGEVIEKHISEEEFNIEDFCGEVAMSRTQLHRKLKALTGKSASLYIRSVKLAKAKKMIEEHRGNISEIAYSVGFSSPVYFTRCFKEEFGYPPRDVKK